MAQLTYKQLHQIISEFTEEELNQTATIYLTGQEEVFAVERVKTVKPKDDISGVLDDGHVVLEIRD